jgi:hypothetical protein
MRNCGYMGTNKIDAYCEVCYGMRADYKRQPNDVVLFLFTRCRHVCREAINDILRRRVQATGRCGSLVTTSSCNVANVMGVGSIPTDGFLIFFVKKFAN